MEDSHHLVRSILSPTQLAVCDLHGEALERYAPPPEHLRSQAMFTAIKLTQCNEG